MTGAIDYGGMMHRAMQGLIAEVLTRVAESELPGEHHFFITFDTREDGVEIADWLRERYPAEMTIVIQHWYEDLHVNADGFEITLNFGNSPERLVIPFDALRTFVAGLALRDAAYVLAVKRVVNACRDRGWI